MIENGFDWRSWGKTKVELPAEYVLGDFIAKGTRGEVYAATRRTSVDADNNPTASSASQNVAIKILRDYKRSLYTSDVRYRRDCLLAVVRELYLLGLSPTCCGVLPLCDVYFSSDKTDLYLVLPRASHSLRDQISQASAFVAVSETSADDVAKKTRKSPLSEVEVGAIMLHILSALNFLHSRAGYAHLDVNSSNVLLIRDGTALKSAALADFSFARPLACPLNTSAILALGYRAPEILFLGGYGGRAALVAELARADEAKGSGSSFQPSYDLRKADIFAAGIIMCEMILGRLPVTGLTVATDFNQTATILPPEPLPNSAGEKPASTTASHSQTPPPPLPVEADIASRKQFLALFHDLVPTFDIAYWESRFNHYKSLREQYPSTFPAEDEVPLHGLEIDDDDVTEIKIKPKIAEMMEDEKLLSAAGVSFLKLLVAEKAEDRPSAAELLRHPWLLQQAALAKCNAGSDQTVVSVCDTKVESFTDLLIEDLESWVCSKVTKSATQIVEVPRR